MNKRTCSILGTIGLLAPLTASAHLKWFVGADDAIERETITYSFRDPFSWLCIGGVLVAFVVAMILERWLPQHYPFWERIGKQRRSILYRLFYIAIGVWLLINTYQGIIFATGLNASTPVERLLQLVQGVIGIAFLTGVLLPAASALWILLLICFGVNFGFTAFIEHVDVIGVAAFAAITGSRVSSPLVQWREWAIPLLRFWAGVALIILAFTEKILHPELGLQFLQTYHWNIMNTLGLTFFTDQRFILCAGSAEVLFGILFLCGLVTRLNTIAFAVVLVTTAVVLGPSEVVGHLPILATALVLLVYGSGKKITLAHVLRRWRAL